MPQDYNYHLESVQYRNQLCIIFIKFKRFKFKRLEALMIKDIHSSTPSLSI